MIIARAERVEGGLLGLLIGDALGVPFEFHPPEALPARDAIELEPPRGFRRSHSRVPVGTWSDDGAQALCLLASLLNRGELSTVDFGNRLVNWFQHGYLAVDGHVFDVGIQTSFALRALLQGVRAEGDTIAGERSNGNGSLMRVLPLALWHRGSDARLVQDASRQSALTHAHPRSQVCCGLYCLWARRVLNDHSEPWAAAVATLRAMLPNGSPERVELEIHVRPDDPAPGEGSGYVVDCLRSARAVVEAGHDYESTVRAAVALGHDTDTTACVAGGVAGIKYGAGSIPARWRGGLRGRDLLTPLMQALIDEVAEVR